MNEDFIKIIRDSLEYNPLNGEFKWKKRLSHVAKERIRQIDAGYE